MRTRLKICGITNLVDARMVVNSGADLLGFNFYPKSPRYISPEGAREIIRSLPLFVCSVGILVKPRLQDVHRILHKCSVQALQIYDPVDFDDFTRIPVPVIAAFRIPTASSPLPELRGANMILLDSYSETHYGGTGRKFPWENIPDSIPRSRLILAGGINPDNILNALEQVRPAVVDVASGAESAPGKKDPRKVRALIDKIVAFNSRKDPYSSQKGPGSLDKL